MSQSQVSIHFNPTTDTADNIKERVDAIFMGFEALGLIGSDDADANVAGAALVPAADGLPWDARIHSTPAKKNKDGSWRAKKGVTPEQVAAVEAELRGQTAAAPTPSAGAANPMGAAHMGLTGAPQNTFVPTQPAPLQMPAMPSATAAPNVVAYQKLEKFITAQIFDAASNPTGRLTTEWVQQALQNNFGVPGGLLQNVATLDAAQIDGIGAGIAGALQIAYA